MLMLLAAMASIPACAGRDLAVSTDARDGDFNGMSHGGTLLIVRNQGRRACTVPGLPMVTLSDARGQALPAVRRAPAGMHPGPVVRPVTLRPGQRLGTGLRWVSGPVYDRSRCYDAASVSVAIGRAVVRASLRAHLCGPAAGPATFDQPVLASVPA
jgi:hypothetical protein